MKLLYKPFGIVTGIASGMLARRIFDAVWARIDDAEPPRATTERASLPRIVGAAALQGATFAATRAATERVGARTFAHLFGVWPGKRDPDKA